MNCLVRARSVSRITEHHAAYGVLPPVIVVSGARHYSITKAADLLGIGRDHVVLVDVDHRFRMDVAHLQNQLLQLKQTHRLPLAVSPSQGPPKKARSIPIHRIHGLRRLRVAAYRCSLGRISAHVFSRPPAISTTYAASSRVTDSHGAIQRFAKPSRRFPKADSITVDPHKLGYIPYPCGVAAYRDDRVRHFLTQEIPYLSDVHREDASMRPPASVGPYILEGSKPGSAVAACWLSHRMIPPRSFEAMAGSCARRCLPP